MCYSVFEQSLTILLRQYLNSETLAHNIFALGYLKITVFNPMPPPHAPGEM